MSGSAPRLRASHPPRTALVRAADWLLRDRGCCLMFHRGINRARWAAKPNRGFHVDLAFLERLIRHLRQAGLDIVTMQEACRRAAQPSFGRFVNFSVDDGYRDTAELVVPLFQQLEAPITLFVATGIADGTMRLRNAGLETILERRDHVVDGGTRYSLTDAASRRAAFAAISRGWDASHDGDDRYIQFCTDHDHSADALDAQHRLDWPMLESLASHDLVEIGAHTMSHPHIASLDGPSAWAEIAGSRARLEQRLGIAVRHFAFPYGQPTDCAERDFALVEQAGFESAATTVKGLIAPRANPFHLPRNTLNGEHRLLPMAYLHLAGLSGPIARQLRHG